MDRRQKILHYCVWGIILCLGYYIIISGFLILSGRDRAIKEYGIWYDMQNQAGNKAVETFFPVLTYWTEDVADMSLGEWLVEKTSGTVLLYRFLRESDKFQTATESAVTYERLASGNDPALTEEEDIYVQMQIENEMTLGRMLEGEAQQADGSGHVQAATEQDDISATANKDHPIAAGRNSGIAQAAEEEVGTVRDAQKIKQKADEAEDTVPVSSKKAANISLEKLQDFDYLMNHFYTVDRTTTIDSSQLNAKTLLKYDLRIKKSRRKKEPQILIYHTHSQEGFRDSREGDESTTIVGVGAYLAELLQEKYGYQVLHHRGVYDMVDGKLDRNRAYTLAGEAVQGILKEHTSIEVIIDLHRDGVPEEKHMVSDIGGEPTAMIMFFNGLSRTTQNGDIDYLYNPYIEDNLAFSLQMQLAANTYYPGFARPIYLKGYRYNLHFLPKSLLVEAGAQNNTLKEELNAMVLLADILDKVLQGK